MWLLGRIGVVALITVAILSIPIGRSNLDWPAAILIGLVVSVALFVWLKAIRYRQCIDWSSPYSTRKPFWPMTKFPLRYWFVTSVGLMVGGAAGIAMTLWSHSGRESVPGTFAVLGLGIFVALRLFIRNSASGT